MYLCILFCLVSSKNKFVCDAEKKNQERRERRERGKKIRGIYI